jgi:predicted nucleotidyltransferase
MAETIAARIRSARLDAGLSQVELARRAGVSQPKLSEYERGVTAPRPETLKRLLASARPRPSVMLERHADEILELGRRHHITAVRVFGSAVHGTDTVDSDIDLLVTLDDDASVLDLAAFEHEVERLSGYPVDIVSDRAADTSVIERIIAESVPL